ncbi:Two component system histidine kinase, partial [Operophtera brumata]
MSSELSISMQRVNIQNNLISPENLKSTEVNNCYFWLRVLGSNGDNLETISAGPFHKSSTYEKKLLRCKATHAHSHDDEEWWDDGYEELSKRYSSLLRAYSDKCGDVANRDKALAHMKQHAEVMHAQLTHAHKALLSVAEKYLVLKKRRNVQRSGVMHAQLVHAHKALLSVAGKYLLLKKRNVQV